MRLAPAVAAVTDTPFVPYWIAPAAFTRCTQHWSGLVVYHAKYAPPAPSLMKGGKLPNCSEPVVKTLTPLAAQGRVPFASTRWARRILAPVKEM